ncbi:hypothetical protein BJY16_004038 [Actinoplanes octamycinicus]|uniref:Energy-coupling factor transport system substrate-specific component n=1 Tax=Actinoplanes octamycinicus TaxID=135948 RepID=A0A7W7GYD5_9ACTN|nr:hypothetical protein [Actinoplanes octamycinicus]MBB4740579.1 hypothetical protein [Actinoplanes octamycinicus]GIE63120.1 hypothetical protein Aoc01nite_85220 [Actinoplanes octamycinicus]
MTVARHAIRTAAFAAAYLLAFWAGGYLFLSALPIAALWLLAQTPSGRRRFDLIALATTTAVAATLNGAGPLLSLAVAAAGTLPALLFAVLTERWAPGWWQGHGDRFRSLRHRLSRVAAAAALSAAAAGLLQAVLLPDTPWYAAPLTTLRDTAAILLVTLAARALRRSRAPRTPGLTLVR